MPSNRDNVGRLFGELKGRQDWTTKISEELLKLWEKTNFPFLSKQQAVCRFEQFCYIYCTLLFGKHNLRVSVTIGHIHLNKAADKCNGLIMKES